MIIKKLSIRFVIKLNKRNNNGQCPLYCRLTYNKRRKVFSTGQLVYPEKWDSKKQVYLAETNEVNTRLNLLKNKLERAHIAVQVSQTAFEVEDIFNQYVGKPIQEKGHLINYYKAYLTQLEKLIEKEIKKSTYKKFEYVGRHLEMFVLWNN